MQYSLLVRGWLLALVISPVLLLSELETFSSIPRAAGFPQSVALLFMAVASAIHAAFSMFSMLLFFVL